MYWRRRLQSARHRAFVRIPEDASGTVREEVGETTKKTHCVFSGSCRRSRSRWNAYGTTRGWGAGARANDRGEGSKKKGNGPVPTVCTRVWGVPSVCSFVARRWRADERDSLVFFSSYFSLLFSFFFYRRRHPHPRPTRTPAFLYTHTQKGRVPARANPTGPAAESRRDDTYFYYFFFPFYLPTYLPTYLPIIIRSVSWSTGLNVANFNTVASRPATHLV